MSVKPGQATSRQATLPLGIVHGHFRFVPRLPQRIGLFQYLPRAIGLGIVGGLGIQVIMAIA